MPVETPEYLGKLIDEAVTEWSGMPWDACRIPAEMQQGALVGMIRDAIWDAIITRGRLERIPPAFYKDEVSWTLNLPVTIVPSDDNTD